MSKYDKLIEEKAASAQFMMDEIKHICVDMPKRSPGSEGEKVACEYMATVMKEQCGCESVELESFKENPGSFFGWLYFTLSFALAGIVLYFMFPALGAAIIALGFALMIFQFGFYKKVVDFCFPEKTGHNVTAIKKCKGEVKARIFFNGHPDAVWNWPVNEKFGGVAFESHIAIVVVGSLIYCVASVIAAIKTGGMPQIASVELYGPVLFWLGIAALVFVPFIIGLYFMWDEKTIVDGANDNLTGCYMGIAILKAMKENGVELENTEVGVILSGSEEAGLRGSMAWCEAHKNDFNDVPTWIISYDTIHDKKFLGVNYRDLNGTVKVDKEVSDAFMEAAKELDIQCQKTWVPPFGGATDSAAFAKAGFKVTGITAMNHALESYYHTRKDSYDNLDAEGLADCFAVSVRTLENFEKKYGSAK